MRPQDICIGDFEYMSVPPVFADRMKRIDEKAEYRIRFGKISHTKDRGKKYDGF